MEVFECDRLTSDNRQTLTDDMCENHRWHFALIFPILLSNLSPHTNSYIQTYTHAHTHTNTHRLHTCAHTNTHPSHIHEGLLYIILSASISKVVVESLWR